VSTNEAEAFLLFSAHRDFAPLVVHQRRVSKVRDPSQRNVLRRRGRGSAVICPGPGNGCGHGDGRDLGLAN
jgi:hypothetical protein